MVWKPLAIHLMDKRLVRPRPTQAQVTLWEMVVLKWLPLLTPYERNLVWKRANRLPWKLLCRELGRTRVHLWRIYDRALFKLTVQQTRKNVANIKRLNTVILSVAFVE